MKRPDRPSIELVLAPNISFLARLVASSGTLLLGLMVLGYIYPDSVTTTPDLSRAGRWLIPLGYTVMVLEALAFTIIPAELSIRKLQRPLPGLAVGWLLYVPVLHWSQGLVGLIASGWIAAVIGCAYCIERGRSGQRAALHALALKALFWTVAWTTLLSAP